MAADFEVTGGQDRDILTVARAQFRIAVNVHDLDADRPATAKGFQLVEHVVAEVTARAVIQREARHCRRATGSSLSVIPGPEPGAKPGQQQASRGAGQCAGITGKPVPGQRAGQQPGQRHEVGQQCTGQYRAFIQLQLHGIADFDAIIVTACAHAVLPLAEQASEYCAATTLSSRATLAITPRAAIGPDNALANRNDFSGLVNQRGYCRRLSDAPIISTVEGGTSPTAVIW